MSMHVMRPWPLFSTVYGQEVSQRIVKMKIPLRRLPEYADYSLRLLELMTLIASIRIVGAKRMFEFGTFCGNSTLHMALNSPPDAFIWTLDADDETLKSEGLYDLYKWRDQFPLEFEDAGVSHKVRAFRGDSHVFNGARQMRPGRPAEYLVGIDLVLIDGDHSLVGVKADTINAFRMLKPGGVILWHDYKNPDCEENTAFLDGLSESVDLVHIEDTMLVLYFQDGAVLGRMKQLSLQFPNNAR